VRSTPADVFRCLLWSADFSTGLLRVLVWWGLISVLPRKLYSLLSFSPLSEVTCECVDVHPEFWCISCSSCSIRPSLLGASVLVGCSAREGVLFGGVQCARERGDHGSPPRRSFFLYFFPQVVSPHLSGDTYPPRPSSPVTAARRSPISVHPRPFPPLSNGTSSSVGFGALLFFFSPSLSCQRSSIRFLSESPGSFSCLFYDVSLLCSLRWKSFVFCGWWFLSGEVLSAPLAGLMTGSGLFLPFCSVLPLLRRSSFGFHFCPFPALFSLSFLECPLHFPSKERMILAPLQPPPPSLSRSP